MSVPDVLSALPDLPMGTGVINLSALGVSASDVAMEGVSVDATTGTLTFDPKTFPNYQAAFRYLFNLMAQNLQNPAGVTLLELLVTIAIVAILIQQLLDALLEAHPEIPPEELEAIIAPLVAYIESLADTVVGTGTWSFDMGALRQLEADFMASVQPLIQKLGPVTIFPV